jgi:hypothetical protein
MLLIPAFDHFQYPVLVADWISGKSNPVPVPIWPNTGCQKRPEIGASLVTVPIPVPVC